MGLVFPDPNPIPHGCSQFILIPKKEHLIARTEILYLSIQNQYLLGAPLAATTALLEVITSLFE